MMPSAKHGDPQLGIDVHLCLVPTPAPTPSPQRPMKRRIPRPNLLPTNVNLAIPGSVVVGGAPTISLMGLAFKAGFAGLGRLAKSKFAKRLREGLYRFRRKRFENMDPGFLKCKILRAEPVMS